MITSNVKIFSSKNSIIFKEHYSAPINTQKYDYVKVMAPLDVDALRGSNQKIILHLRDLRQVLLSLYWHLDEHRETEFIPTDLHSWYYSQDRSIQFDWLIENLLPNLVSWTEDWMTFKAQEDSIANGLPILITTYDELLADKLGLYQKILNFYEIERNYATLQIPAKDRQVRFRKGDPEEWRTAFSPAQKKRIAELVPVELLQRFGWSTEPN